MKIVKFSNKTLEAEFKQMLETGHLTQKEYELKMFKGHILGGSNVAKIYQDRLTGLLQEVEHLKDAIALCEHIATYKTSIVEEEP